VTLTGFRYHNYTVEPNTGKVHLFKQIGIFLIIIEGFSEDDDDDNASSCTTLSRVQSASVNKVSSCSSSNGTHKASSLRNSASAGSKRQSNNWVNSGSKEDGDVKPALVQSLFQHVAPTIYFTVEGEKGKSLQCTMI